MVSLTVRKLDRKAKGRGVSTRKVRGPDGKLRRQFIIDANSPTFTDDLTYVFQKNVEAIRRENKKLFGHPDGVRKKDGRQQK
jgi:hypothetical protein